MAPRTVEERIKYMRAHPPGAPNMCARTTWEALGPGGVGEVPFGWFAAHGPTEHYQGWSSWYGVPLPM